MMSGLLDLLLKSVHLLASKAVLLCVQLQLEPRPERLVYTLEPLARSLPA